jgi:hypothetical protein
MPFSREGWSPATLALHNIDQLMRMWDNVVIATPKMQPLAVRNALPLLQQVQSSTRLLSATAGTPPPPAAAAAAASRSLPSGMRIGGRSVSMGYVVTKAEPMLVHIQLSATALLYRLGVFNNGEKGLERSAVAPFKQLLMQPEVAELLLQVLATLTAALHQEHVSEMQQQSAQPQTDTPSNTGSSSRDTAAAAQDQNHHQQQQQQQRQQQQKLQRADLLPIPAFHEDMAAVLPGGQGYLQAAAEGLAALQGSRHDYMHALRDMALEVVTTWQFVLIQTVHSIVRRPGSQTLDSVEALLSPHGVKLLLQMQLLAAGRVARQSRLRQQQRADKKSKEKQQTRQQQQQHEEEIDPRELNKHLQASLLLRSSSVLAMVIKTAVRGGRSCLPPGVLQQAGLQLLQALAAPMQQRLLSKASDPFVKESEDLLGSSVTSAALYGAVLHTQYSLRAATCGLGPRASEWWLLCSRSPAVSTVEDDV